MPLPSRRPLAAPSPAPRLAPPVPARPGTRRAARPSPARPAGGWCPLGHGEQFACKSDLGNWANVEETSSCGYVSSRSFGSGPSCTASGTVAAWGGIGGC